MKIHKKIKSGKYIFMMKKNIFITYFFKIFKILILLIIYAYIANVLQIPSEITLLKGEKVVLRKMYGIELLETANTSSENKSTRNIKINAIGKINLKNVNINVLENTEVVPIGKIIGLKLYTNGVLIVGMSEVENQNNELIKPYENVDIKAGDTILKIDEKEIETIENLKDIVNNSKGKNMKLTLLKGDGSVCTSSIKAVQTLNNDYKLGLWVKDAATGVGTITFYEKNSKSFGALGHGITDNDTNRLINIDSGEVVTSRVLSIKKGEKENPGEIKGTIINQTTIGDIKSNTSFGIFGTLKNLTSLNIDTAKSYKVAFRDEIQEGSAKILCSLGNEEPKEYDICIEKIYTQNNSDNKSMLIRVTDEELLEKTGGIIRGLSGAPIIQNEKFIGAVTNVLVSNPEIGYAIFGDLMIKQLIF